MNRAAYIARMTRNDLARLVLALQETLWPVGDEDGQWSADTLDEIEAIFKRFNLTPNQTATRED